MNQIIDPEECTRSLHEYNNNNNPPSYLYNHFLALKKGNGEEAMDSMNQYIYTRNVTYSHLTANLLTPESISFLQTGTLQFLKYRDDQGRVIIVDRVRFWDPDLHSWEDVVKTYLLFVDELVRSRETGIVLIFDYSQASFKQMRQVTFKRVLTGIHLFGSNFPLQPKAVHFINEGKLLKLLYNSVQFCIKKKLKERVHFHNDNIDLLHDCLSRKILPECLGGILQDVDAFDLERKERMLRNKSFLDD